MFAPAHLRALFVALSVALAGAAACHPALPPPATPSVATLTAIAPPPPLAAAELPPSDAARAREKLLYPYNLPQYDDLVSEIAAVGVQTRGQPGAKPPPVTAQ